MASWGALSGLGAGLQQFGKEWSSQAKDKLAEDLLKQREDRAEDRQRAREQRQEAARLQQVDPRASDIIVDPTTGAMKRQLRNSNYDILNTIDVSETEAEGLRRKQATEEAELNKRSLDAQLKQMQVERTPVKWGQEDQMHNARLGSEASLQQQRQASARASDRRGLESAVTDQGRNSATDAQTLVSAYPDLVKEYTTAPRDGQAKLSRDQVEELAHSVIRRSAEREESPAQVAARFREALRIMAARNQPTSSTPTRKNSLLGN